SVKQMVNQGDLQETLLCIFARHFVSLIWVDAPIDPNRQNSAEYRPISVSGFLIEVSGRWFIATAGHVLRQIDQLLQSDRHMVDCFLYAGWSLEDKLGGKIAFNYDHSDKWFIDNEEEALDYGLISISPYIAAHLTAIDVF